MENFDHILIFKTDVKSESDRMFLQPVLNAVKGIEQWNVDLDDEDYVLRVISTSLKHHHIIELLNYHGYNCCELT